MTYEERLLEFSKIKTFAKFTVNSLVVFSDNLSVGRWYAKNKHLIENSDDDISITIKMQRRQCMDELNLKRGNGSYKYQLMKDRVANEFLECDNLDKFNSDSTLTLKNGLRMYTWYMNNKNLILSSKANVYVLIRNQLEKKKLLDDNKKEIENKKKRILFSKCHDINKFNPKSNTTFNDGSIMGLWFESNKDKIFNSRLPIDVEIVHQKDLYDSYVDLAKEFAEEESYEKFNPDGNMRFISRSLMQPFFECHINNFINAYDKTSLMIMEQYNEYKKMYVDEDKNTIAKTNVKKD